MKSKKHIWKCMFFLLLVEHHPLPNIRIEYKLNSSCIRASDGKRTCHQSLFFSFSSDPVFPRSGTALSGPLKWRSGAFWSAPGCYRITCLTLCFERSTVWPPKGPSPSARRLATSASTTLSDVSQTHWLLVLSAKPTPVYNRVGPRS